MTASSGALANSDKVELPHHHVKLLHLAAPPLSPRDVVAMSAYFARHEVDKASKSHEWVDETDPSAGYIAWLLWGGEPGRRWADSLTARLNKTAAE